MAQLRKLQCQTCGGPLGKVSETHYICQSCKGEYEMDSNISDETLMNLNRASSYRQKGNFDEAIEEYELMLRDDSTNFDANWGAMLSEYGVVYSKREENYVPVLYRLNPESIFNNIFYQEAMRSCTLQTEKEAAARLIDSCRARAIKLSKTVKSKIMLCCLETDRYGNETLESKTAILLRQLMSMRTKQDVFYSGIDLAVIPFADYEPYVCAALNQAELLLVVTSSKDSCNASYVFDIWKRYAKLLSNDKSKHLCTVCVDYDGNGLPFDLKKSKVFAIKDGDFNALLDYAESIFPTENSVEKSEPPVVEPKPKKKSESQSKNKNTSSSSSSTVGSMSSKGSDVDAQRPAPSVSNASFGGGVNDNSIHTSPEALHRLAEKLRTYARAQNGLLTQCYSNLASLTYDWDDSHMQEILGELRNIEINYESKMPSVLTFADWLDGKAALLSQHKNIK